MSASLLWWREPPPSRRLRAVSGARGFIFHPSRDSLTAGLSCCLFVAPAGMKRVVKEVGEARSSYLLFLLNFTERVLLGVFLAVSGCATQQPDDFAGGGGVFPSYPAS